MKLLLFALLCLVTLLVIRRFQGSPREPSHDHGRGSESKPPAASDDEIVDVRFEEFEDPKQGGGEDR